MRPTLCKSYESELTSCAEFEHDSAPIHNHYSMIKGFKLIFDKN